MGRRQIDLWENAPSEETRGCHRADNRHRVWSTNDLYPRVVFVSLGGGRGDVAEMMHCLVIISMMVVMV